MYNVSDTAPSTSGTVRPDATARSLSSEAPSQSLFDLIEVFNTQFSQRQPVRSTGSVAKSGATREATPSECQLRLAIGIRSAFELRAMKSPEASKLVERLIHGMNEKQMPKSDVLALWNRSLDTSHPRDSRDASAHATANAVRCMLANPPGHVRIADELTQGIWMRVGMMAAALWPGQAKESSDVQKLADLAIDQLLACKDTDSLHHCADAFRDFAGKLQVRHLQGTAPHSGDVLAFSGRLAAAARQVHASDNDAYYSLLGRQLGSVGASDRTILALAQGASDSASMPFT